MDDLARHPVTVGVIGFGTIGRVHRDVLNSDERFAVTFIADPNLPIAGTPSGDLPLFHDLSTALESIERRETRQPDLIVLATPTQDHLGMASQVLQRTGSSVLCEKPLAENADAIDRFTGTHLEASRRLRIVNHFAFSPEVEWAVGHAATHGWGAPAGVISTFNDPYALKSAQQRATYVSSWVDSGPNQLGLLARFASHMQVRSHSVSEDGMRCSETVEFDGGRGVLLSNWMSSASSKSTVLRWPLDREIHLDHTAMTALAVEGGRRVGHFSHDASVDRKFAHYAAMYNRLVSNPADELFSLGFARTVATTLHAATRARVDSTVAWHGASFPI